MLKELIDAYNSRLKSYRFLLDKLEREMEYAQEPRFLQFCECETKRLDDLIQLSKQVIGDLESLQASLGDQNRLDAPIKKPEEK
tara:strand:- start:322 stop:573 length:252 start_codon:yes stop_codon:yes gene_type:complete